MLRPRPVVDERRLLSSGLDAAEVAERVRAGLANGMPNQHSRSLAHIIGVNLFTVFNGVVGAGTIVLLVLGDWLDAIFGLAALTNLLIGVVQQNRARVLLDSLTLMQAPGVRVLRDGAIVEVAAEGVVLDDLLVLRAGDQVSADAVVLAATGIEIDESLLTGESDPVRKKPGDAVLSGSIVTVGEASARVIRVGAESYSNSLTSEAKKFSAVRSELRDAANRVVRWVTWCLLPLIALVFNAQVQAEGGWDVALQSGRWREALVGTVSSAASIIPQGLVLMTSIAFTLATAKLARAQVLVQQIESIEVLARVDMICFDKTGTLTEGDIVFDAVHHVGSIPVPGWESVLAHFGADDNANATARALTAAFSDVPAARTHSIPFSSERKWSAIRVGTGPARGTWVLGAPDVILPGVEGERASSSATSASNGMRTLALARTDEALSSADDDEARLPAGLTATALITFVEKIRPDAAATLEYFREQGVEMRVFSGDNPATVAAVARDVGLEFDGDGFDARTLPSDAEEMADVLAKNIVFGRVTPSQKREMVAALQARGHVVAMTGDGVNDALALKRADIGIAMGSGAAATRVVARLILLDNKFARLPSVIAEGRRVIANIELVSHLFLTKTTYAMLLSIVVGVMLWKFPFLPRQFAPVDGFTIGIPAFFLALAVHRPRYRPGFLRRALVFAIPSGIVISTAIAVVLAFAQSSGDGAGSDVRTAAVITLASIGWWVLVVVARPLNRWRTILVAVMGLAIAACVTVPFMQLFLQFEIPEGELLYVAVAASTIGCVAIEVIHRVVRRMR